MIRTVQTGFTSGMLDPTLRDHFDLNAYRNGAQEIANCRLLPQGGLTRRAGTDLIDRVNNDTYQIEPFIFSDSQQYVFFFRNVAVDIYDRISRTFVVTKSGPWTTAQITAGELRVSQQLDTMIVSHEDFETQIITRTSSTTFTIGPVRWSRSATDSSDYMPFHKYAAGTVTLTPSAMAVGAATVTASSAVFVAGHVGLIIRYRKKQMTVTGFTSSTVLDVNIDQALPAVTADYDWDEQAFSSVRGWARCYCLHLQRLWIGGGRDCPNVVWGSSLNDPFSMGLGTGAEDDGIKYTIYADRVAQIVSMVSNGFLQIFTTQAEFYVPKPDSNALTPSSFSIECQSRYGSAALQARPFDQTSVFITKKSGALREFVYDALQGSFAADALTFMSKSLLSDPVDLDVQTEGIGAEQECRAYVSNTDGTIAVLAKVKKENIAGWSYWDTEGKFVRLGVIDNELWAITARDVGGGGLNNFIEVFTPDRRLDFAATASGAASTHWGPFNLHKGATVHVIAGDLYLGEFLVDGTTGMLAALPYAVTEIEIGFNYTPLVVPLQQHVQLPDGVSMAEPKRYVSMTCQLVDTLSCRIKNRDLPQGVVVTPGTAPDRFTGHFKARLLGWGTTNRVEISSPLPLPFTLNSLVTELEL